MMRRFSLLAVLFYSTALIAAGPGCGSLEAPLVFRTQTAEVHVTFTAVGDHNQLVTDLSGKDFKLLRDGTLVEDITGFESLKDASLALIVLADISESMRNVLPLENAAKAYLSQKFSSVSDSVSFLDFGAMVHPAGLPGDANGQLTSMYDSALEVAGRSRASKSRNAVLLITDGGDNYSLHSVQDVIAAAQTNDVAFYVMNTDPWNESAGKNMRALAEKTGGRYFVIENKAHVFQALQQIETELRNTYLVTFRADKSGSGKHRLSFESTERPLRFFHRAVYFQPAAVDAAHSENNYAKVTSR